MRVDLEEIRDELRRSLSEYILSSQDVGYCDECQLLRYDSDCGCYDCPYGLAADSCEFSPMSSLENNIDDILGTIVSHRP